MMDNQRSNGATFNCGSKDSEKDSQEEMFPFDILGAVNTEIRLSALITILRSLVSQHVYVEAAISRGKPVPVVQLVITCRLHGDKDKFLAELLTKGRPRISRDML